MTPRLVIRDLGAGYGHRRVIDAMSPREWTGGHVVALAGPNGSGKSTLLRAVAGLIRASGSIVLSGRELASLSPPQRAREISYLPQGVSAGTPFLAMEAAIAALRITPDGRQAGSSDIRRRALNALDRLGIVDLAFEPLDRLSGGQRQLAAFAPILARRTPVVLLDEPTSALDLRARLELMDVIREIAQGGAIVIVVLHDLGLAARLADHVVVLDRGRIYGEGPPREAVTPRMLAAVYGVEAHVEVAANGMLNVIAERPLSHPKSGASDGKTRRAEHA